MRIATSMIYNRTVTDMNETMQRLMNHRDKEATQKRLNKPSDDPGGYSLALDMNSYIKRLSQFDSNIGTAKAWLNLGDSTMSQVSNILIKTKELAEQSSTGTLSPDQRKSIADQARALFKQTVTLTNTHYNGKSIFAGHKTDSKAYEMGLGSTLTDSRLAKDTVTNVTGGSNKSIALRFPSGGIVGSGTATAITYTTDGGATWKDATLAAGATSVTVEGTTIHFKNNATLPVTGKNKTAIVIRPAAIYKGDDADTINVRHSGTSSVTANAAGALPGPVSVRIDSAGSLTGSTRYSYTTDGGETWIMGNTAQNGVFPIPGGTLTISPAPATTLIAGEQFLATPNAARISMEIGPNAHVDINSIGKDIFGGLYQRPGEATPTEAIPQDPQRNLLEAMGAFVGYLESNDQTGVSKVLARLNSAHKHITTMAGEIGARETRIEVMQKTVELHKDNTTTHKSQLEDQDIIQLRQDIEREMFVYKSIGTTSAKFMDLSILKYI